MDIANAIKNSFEGQLQELIRQQTFNQDLTSMLQQTVSEDHPVTRLREIVRGRTDGP